MGSKNLNPILLNNGLNQVNPTELVHIEGS